MKRRDAPSMLAANVLDAEVEPVPGAPAPATPTPASAAERADIVTAQATTALAVRPEAALFGSDVFFARALEELLASTSAGLELAGAAFAQTVGRRTVLVGLRRNVAGQPGKVAIDSTWGSLLWHTHPGLRGSLAAFSNDDLEVAKVTGKPLLVIGFGGLSPDVLTTFAMGLGMRPLMAAAGLKGLMSLEKRGVLRERMLRLGVAARVCWPSGVIQPVLRSNASPARAAFDEMSFAVDRGVGAVERAGQRVLKDVLAALLGGPRP